MLMVPPPLQLAASNPRAWDAHWEELIAMAYADPDFVPGKQDSLEAYCIRTYTHGCSTNALVKENILYEYRILREGLCALQAQITREAMLYFVRSRLEERWIVATPTERGKHVLAASAAVCSSAMNLHQAREVCAVELNVASHKKDGKLLIRLVKEMMVENPATSPENPVFVSHPVWDAIEAAQRASHASADEQIVLGYILVLRNKLIAHVVFHVLRSFLGLEIPKILVGKHVSNKKATAAGDFEQITDRLVERLGKAEATNRIRLEREAAKELYSQRKQGCFNCGKLNETTTKYSRCKRCWDNVKRETLYCSPTCQKADWKAGHKTTCGQPLTLEDIGPATPERRGATQPPVIGFPSAGFKRSVQLMYQVGRINQSPEHDYFIWTAAYPIHINFPHKPVQAAVLAARAKALASGDRPSVAKLAHMLIFVSEKDSRSQSLGVTQEIIVKQFKDEYEFEEIERAMDDEMRVWMAKDPLRRPPLLIDAGLSAGAWEEYRKTWAKSGLADIGIVPVHPRVLEEARRDGVL